MPIETYLLEGEGILAQAGDFYATNKRLIRYRKKFLKEEWEDIPYSHLTSIGTFRSPRRGFLWAGIAIIGFASSSLVSLALTASLLKSLSGFIGAPVGFDLAPLIPPHLVGLGLGMALILLGIFLPNVYIEFRTPGLNKQAEARFRLKGVRKEASLNLVRIIRQQSLGLPEAQSVYVRPPTNRGNQTPGQ